MSCRLPLLCLALAWTVTASAAGTAEKRPAATDTPPKIELSIQPGEARPGDPVAIRVRGATGTPKGTMGELPLVFFPYLDGHLALASLPMETPLGSLDVTIFPTRTHPQVDGTLQVVDPAWRTRELTVSKQFTEKRSAALKKRILEDRKAFEKAMKRRPAEPRFKASFAVPRDAAFTAFFGDRRLFNGKQKSQHYGLDLDGAIGAPIHASNDGVVVLVRDCWGSGNTVIVDHGADLYTLYFHLSAYDVKEGDVVKRGQLLGKVGKSGRVTGPHLHWSVKIGGRYVNPEGLLKLDLL